MAHSDQKYDFEDKVRNDIESFITGMVSDNIYCNISPSNLTEYIMEYIILYFNIGYNRGMEEVRLKNESTELPW